MGNLFPRWGRDSDAYKGWIKQFGVQQVEEVYNQLDEMEEWIPEMETKQLIMYVGCFDTFNELPESRAYIQENFPDLLENQFRFQTLSAMSDSELRNRGYGYKEKMLDAFYDIMGIEFEEEANDPDAEWDALPLWQKICYAIGSIGLLYLIGKGIYWLYTVIF